MERAEVLMLKLQEQYRKKETAAQMLVTLHLLQQELMQLNEPVSQLAKDRSKVSVVLPFRRSQATDEIESIKEEKTLQVLHVDEAEVEQELEQIKQSAEMKNEISMKLRPLFQEQYDPMEDVPTLASHIAPIVPAKPQPAPSPETAFSPQSAIQPPPTVPADTLSKELNEKLKDTTKEVGHKLQDTPIKDLRKAIGINDRYLYINELFNGDEAMFERSVKTLNQFSILPEAEFWMQRELRIKLAWKEDNVLVHQFVQLVRRRFS